MPQMSCYYLANNVIQTMAVGDGANDLPMCRIAGLSVAYHAKPALQEEVNVCLTY